MGNFNFNKPPKPLMHAFSMQSIASRISVFFFRATLIVFALVALALTATSALADHSTIEDWAQHDDNFADLVVIERPIVVNRPEPTFGGCFLSKGHGLLPDLDCDKVPDFADNCPHVRNPDQFDQTGNGVGDACDLYIAFVDPNPPVVLQGRSLLTTIGLTNYRDYDFRNLRISVEIPTLGVKDDMQLGVLPMLASTDTELHMRIPDCALPGEYTLVATIEYPYTAGRAEVFVQEIKVAVEQSGACPFAPEQKTIVNVLEIQDIDKVEGGVYPYTITNLEPYDQIYVLSIEGTKPWGYSQIEPRTLVVVPAGESREGALRIWANEGYEGEHGFVLTVQSEQDIKQLPLLADIKEEPKRSVITLLTFTLGGLIVIALLIFVVFLVVSSQKKKQKNGVQKKNTQRFATKQEAI